MKPRWELGVLLTVAFFSSAQAITSSDCSTSFISDGWCDSSNNNSDCDYDGGDCCICDCFDDTYECGVVGFTCIDPTSDCTYHHYYDDDEQQATYSPSPVHTVTYSPTAYPVYDYDDDDDDEHDDHDQDDSPTYYDGFLDDDDDDGFFDSSDTSQDDNDRATSDDAPVGAIVGGAVGGTVFLAAAAVLGCLFFTGRLKCSKCSSSSDPPAAPAGDGTTRAATKAYPAPVAADGGAPAGPRSDFSPPPAFLAPAGDGSSGTATRTYPAPAASAAGAPAGSRNDLPPPPASLAPNGDRSPQMATETFPEPTASAAAPAAPDGDLPPPPAYGSHDHDATTPAALPPPYGHTVNQYSQPK
ncbi:unnamed protein product [Ectocarpus sp. 6 AP-2014]